MTTGLPQRTRDDIEYPSSDGRPVAETELHVDELLAMRDTLKRHFAPRPDVYAGGNMLFYYEKGNPAARFSPDVFVAIGVPKRRRRIYRIWQEGAAPTFVLEISSRGSWLEDAGNKKTLCARLGVQEYFLFDPEADYLDPPLQGFALRSGEYQRVEPTSDGKLESRALGIAFYAEGPRLHAIELATGKPLLRPEELEPAWHRAESERAEADRARAEAETRAAEAEREIERLERELAKAQGRE